MKLVFELMKLNITEDDIQNALECILNDYPRDKYTSEIFFSAGAMRIKVYERNDD